MIIMMRFARAVPVTSMIIMMRFARALAANIVAKEQAGQICDCFHRRTVCFHDVSSLHFAYR